MNKAPAQTAAISPILIQLFKGVLYAERRPGIWQDLLTLQGQVMDYFGLIGLTVVIDEAEGYAFLRQIPREDQEEGAPLPRLITKRPLGYPLSILLVVLRKKLAEFDAQSGETRLILEKKQIMEMVQVFMPSQKNEARTMDAMAANIKKAADLGFLKKLPAGDELYEVKRIIKALVDADWLKDLDQLMDEYMEYAKDND